MQTTASGPTTRTDTPMTWTPWVNVAIGIAAIITPFAGGGSTAITTSDVITGIIIGIVALIAFFTSQSKQGMNVAIINILAGVWLIISTSFAHGAMLVWDNVMLGVLAILTAIISMGAHQQLMRRA
jgi:uncharacterized membrane protein HdeD (DUF308 family)